MEKIKSCLEVLQEYKSQFENTRNTISKYFKDDRPVKKWEFANDLVFTRYDQFIKRVELIEVIVYCPLLTFSVLLEGEVCKTEDLCFQEDKAICPSGEYISPLSRLNQIKVIREGKALWLAAQKVLNLFSRLLVSLCFTISTLLLKLELLQSLLMALEF